MLKKQIIGIVNLSLPLIVIYSAFPILLLTVWGPLLGALLVGAYVYYILKTSDNRLIASLRYGPTDERKHHVNALIISCGQAIERIGVHYAYTQQQLAMAVHNTIIIDPTTCKDTEGDPDADKVCEIFRQFIDPGLVAWQKDFMSALIAIHSPKAFNFIVRHEVGHIVDRYSDKKLGILFCASGLAAYVGILTARAALPWGGAVAIVGGMLVGGIVDMLTKYPINLFFQLPAEYRADRFALRYSTTEEIEAAAEFFEAHQRALDTHVPCMWISRYLPHALITGYPHGGVRARYLREYVQK